VTATVLRNVSVNKERAFAAASTGYMNATELADYLVRKGVPFREAHELVGKMVMCAIEAGKEIQELGIEELKEFWPQINADVIDALSLERTVGSKAQAGGTAPESVAAALAQARRSLNEDEA